MTEWMIRVAKLGGCLLAGLAVFTLAELEKAALRRWRARRAHR